MENYLIINKNINICILQKNKKKFIIFASKHYYLKYYIKEGNILYFNKNCRTISFKKTNYDGFLQNKQYFLKILLFNLNNYTIKKIKFLGKSYKIKKKKKNFFLEFNNSHPTFFLWKNIFLKKLKKTKIILKNTNEKTLINMYYKIINIRFINPFTKRGLRLSRQIVYKKIGKRGS